MWTPPSESIFSGRRLERRERAAVALLIGVAAGLAAYLAFQRMPSMLARDFTFPLRGANALIAGQNPYEVIRADGPPPFDMQFMYPLTAAIAAIPFAVVPMQLGGALFVTVSAFLLAYLVTARGMGGLWLFLSAPFGLAAVLAQWSPLLMAAALSTPLSWALACKPTIGAALFLYRPSWRALAMCGLFFLLAFLVLPGWLPQWLRVAGTVREHWSPVTRPLGALPLLALLRWRRPEARLVAAMALVPQNLYFYDQLPLWLVARSGRSAVALTILSWVAWAGTSHFCRGAIFCGSQAEPWVMALIYLPATALVLIDRESVGWLRRAIGSLAHRTDLDRQNHDPLRGESE